MAMNVACILAGLTIAQAQTPLEPGQTKRFNFPDLPRAYDAPAACTVRVPDDYTKDRKFPLLVYLEGGRGDGSNVAVPRAIAGDRGAIVASFPLFRREHNPKDAWSGIRVGFDDYPIMLKAYQAMLDRLRKEIPNIDPKHSVMGGNSNGAYTIGVLLSMLDANTLDSFRGFFFIDGGFNWDSYYRTQRLKDHHLLFLVAEGDKSDPDRKYVLTWTETLKRFAQKHGMAKWQFSVMPGLDHGIHRQHYPVLRAWLRDLRAGS